MLCDSCKSASAAVFCRADTAYLCAACDSRVHAANKLASRHARVWVCEVCEQAPACVTCKADAAHLCSTCDSDIHSANPLARRHERVPLAPFYDASNSSSSSAATATASEEGTVAAAHQSAAAKSAAISKLFGEECCYYEDGDGGDGDDSEAATWLLPNEKESDDPTPKSIDFLFSGGEDMDPYLDLDFGADPKPDPDPSSDGVVPDPDHKHNSLNHQPSLYPMPGYHHNSSHFDGFESSAACKPYTLSTYTATQSSLSHSVSSSSLDFGVVPDANAMADVASTGFDKQQQMKMVGMDREARVLRYREKRKNRKFEKTIRYASRKAYAETRPRIKGRFAKRSDVEAASSVDSLFAPDPGYGVVPSF